MGWKLVNRYIGEAEGFPSFPLEPGNYAIYVCNVWEKEKPILMYIGTAQNLRRRLERHEIRKTLWALVGLSWYNHVIVKCCVVDEITERKARERKLIRRLSPPVNVALKEKI